VTVGRVTRPSGQPAEGRRLRQPLPDRCGRKKPGARGGELDRERQPGQVHADLGGGRGVVVRQRERRLYGTPALYEELDRGIARKIHWRRAGLRQRKRGNGELTLGAQTQRLTAGDDELDPWTCREQLADRPCGIHHVFEIVEQEKYPLPVQTFDEQIEGGHAAVLEQTECVRYG